MRKIYAVVFFINLVTVLSLPYSARAGDQPYIGELILFAGNFCPSGWASANGQLLPIAENDALFNLLGTTYGGDGQTTFALPDLRGRAPVHIGQGPGLSNVVEGEQGGAETVTLNMHQIPAHNHPLLGSSNVGTQLSPQGSLPAVKDRITSYTLPGNNEVPMANDSIGSAGGNQPVEIRSPYLAMTWCIALFGVFPSQN